MDLASHRPFPSVFAAPPRQGERLAPWIRNSTGVERRAERPLHWAADRTPADPRAIMPGVTHAQTRGPTTASGSKSSRSGWSCSTRSTRTVTETDNVLFTTMTMNPARLHLDAEYAAETEFGQVLVNSMFTDRAARRDVGAGDHPRHDDREPRLRGGRLPGAGVPRRHHPRRERGGREPGVEVAARRRDRHLRAPWLQPARRARVPGAPQRLDVATTGRPDDGRDRAAPQSPLRAREPARRARQAPA